MKVLSAPGGLVAPMFGVPRTILEAMRLTKLLGYRYLWVDRYCIVQDSEEDKIGMIRAMDIIYTAAVLTICAAEGDSNFGLSGIPGHNRDFNQKFGKYN